MKWWFKLAMFLGAIVILYVSFVMASLNRVVDDEKFDRLRKIEMTYINSRGEENCYKLPESRVLPNNIFYPAKELRDNLWIYFSRNKVDQLRILLLVRDKKIEEVLVMIENSSNKKLIDKQIIKIKEISDELDLKLREIDDKELVQRVRIADGFYRFIYEKLINGETIRKCYE